MKEFKKGYLVEIQTWENDADNRKITQAHCNSEADVKLLIRFLEYFRSGSNDYSGKLLLGNATVTFDDMKLGRHSSTVYYNDILFAKYLKENDTDVFNWIFSTNNQDIEDSDDAWYYYIGDFVRTTIDTWDWGECVRVLEDYKIYYIPEDVTFKEVKF